MDVSSDVICNIICPPDFSQNDIKKAGIKSDSWEIIPSTTQTTETESCESKNSPNKAISAAFCTALHMHQPSVPAGFNGEIISNLQHMFEHPEIPDAHNAGPFLNCYGRMGDIIPRLCSEGFNPRIMLDYSGTLLWGLQQLSNSNDQIDVFEKLKRLTHDEELIPHVEFLGTFWGHAVSGSLPVPDFSFQVQCWRSHFQSIFGQEALDRVKGFSLPEMQLCNHPESLFHLITTLKENNYRYMLVQEHTIEEFNAENKIQNISNPNLPHVLITRNCNGEEVSIIVLIKTQGSDTKLVGQMQPYYEAKTKQKCTLGKTEIFPLVTQIADGENGGVMMNEFPGAFDRAWMDIKDNESNTSSVVGMNANEYLDYVFDAGVKLEDLPKCYAKGQNLLWDHLKIDMNNVPKSKYVSVSRDELSTAISELTKSEGHRFSMEGGSWTNERSWIEGYKNVTQPMHDLSVRFHQNVENYHKTHSSDNGKSPDSLTENKNYQTALLYLLLLQCSCFRYWGQGQWTDYARELYRRGMCVLEKPF